MKLVQPSVAAEVTRRHSFRFKKQLGQNFLVDGNILRKIVEAAELSPGSAALEIGPGIGTLTEALAETEADVVAVEKDADLIPILAETLAAHPRVRIIPGDILELPLDAMLPEWFGARRARVVANLPYYVTTPIIMRLLEEELPIHSLVIMVQREVAERMNAQPGGRDYGSLSIAVQYYAKTELVCSVPAAAFYPRPNVDSTVIKLSLRDAPAVRVVDEKLFFRLVRAGFAHRRKTLANNLLSAGLCKNRQEADRVLEQCSIAPTRRAETLSLAEFGTLADALATGN